MFLVLWFAVARWSGWKPRCSDSGPCSSAVCFWLWTWVQLLREVLGDQTGWLLKALAAYNSLNHEHLRSLWQLVFTSQNVDFLCRNSQALWWPVRSWLARFPCKIFMVIEAHTPGKCPRYIIGTTELKSFSYNWMGRKLIHNVVISRKQVWIESTSVVEGSSWNCMFSVLRSLTKEKLPVHPPVCFQNCWSSPKHVFLSPVLSPQGIKHRTGR